MKIKTPIHTMIYTKEMLKDPDLFMQRVAHFCEHFPELYPEKCGHWEPLQVPFTLSRDVIIPNDRNGAADRFYWQHSKKKRANGGFYPSWAGLTHSTEYLCCESTQVDQQEIIDYVKKTCVQFDADFAVIDMNPINTQDITPDTQELKYYLPQMYWGVVFGKPYVDLFGMEHLLNTPAHYVEQLSEHQIYIQLTADIQDVFDRVDLTNLIREEIANHISEDAFLTEKYTLDFGDTMRYFSGIKSKKKQDRELYIPRQSHYLSLYESPRFELKSDAFQQAEVAPHEMESYLKAVKSLKSQRWQLDLTQDWVLEPFVRPDDAARSLKHGEADVIRFFHVTDDFRFKPDATLLIESFSRDDYDTMTQYANKFMNHLTQQYHDSDFDGDWIELKKTITYYDGYAILEIDQHIVYDNWEIMDCDISYRVASKVIVFSDMLVKVTLIHYLCDDLFYSENLSKKIFDHFVLTESVV